MKYKILWIVTLLPLLFNAIAVNFMTDQVPMHYDINGNIDRWGSKYESFLFPCIVIVLTVLWLLFMKFYSKKEKNAKTDKERKEASNNKKVLYYVALCEAAFFTIMDIFITFSSFVEVKNSMSTMAFDINVITNVLLGIFLIVIGNVVPKTKRNSLVGVRTIWSMKDDTTWSKSNRFGGISLVISGFIIIVEALIFKGIVSTLIMLGIIIADAIITCVYSYKISKTVSN